MTVPHGSGPLGASYHIVVASLPTYIILRSTASGVMVEVVVQTVRGVDLGHVSPGHALQVAQADESFSALLRLWPSGNNQWDLIATTIIPVTPLHTSDLDVAIKATLDRAVRAQAFVPGPAAASVAAIPPIRHDTGDRLLPTGAETTLLRVLTTVESTGGVPAKYSWMPSHAAFTVGPFVFTLSPSPVPVIVIRLPLAELDHASAGMRNTSDLVGPHHGPHRLTLVGDGDNTWIARTAHVVLCETATDNIINSMAMMAETNPALTAYLAAVGRRQPHTLHVDHGHRPSRTVWRIRQASRRRPVPAPARYPL